MITMRPSAQRGAAEHGWLSAKHSFSFGQYYDPAHMSYCSLRVINEDRVQPKAGFPTHGHKDMEILTYVISGALEHKDSMGNGSIIRPGELQYMSAGTGVQHSEFNHSQSEITHLLQIWIVPDKTGYSPAYNQIYPDLVESKPGLRLVAQSAASDAGDRNVISVRQDMKLFTARMSEKEEVEYALAAERGLWIQLISGSLEVQGQKMHAGDGAAIEKIPQLKIKALAMSEFLLFDLK